MDALVAANEITDPNLIVAGLTLTIPDAASPERSTSATTYQVTLGDSVWAIAASHGVSTDALVAVNELRPDALIFPGEILAIPNGTEVTEVTARPVAAPAPSSTHTVEAGDTLSEIADRWGVSIGELADANNIGSISLIQIGQVLDIPGSGSSLEGLPADLRGDPARLALAPTFDRWAGEYDVPADLVKALAWFESGWNNEKLSSANAIGIGQILPITADFVSDVLVGETLDPYVEEDNIRLSVRYMRYLLDNAGSVELAVASYYQGLTATREHGIYDSSQFYVDGIIALRERFQ